MHRRTLAALLATGLFAAPVGAATFPVTSNADSGAGTLRAAILAANVTPAADTITFNLATGQRTIALASSLRYSHQPCRCFLVRRSRGLRWPGRSVAKRSAPRGPSQ